MAKSKKATKRDRKRSVAEREKQSSLMNLLFEASSTQGLEVDQELSAGFDRPQAKKAALTTSLSDAEDEESSQFVEESIDEEDGKRTSELRHAGCSRLPRDAFHLSPKLLRNYSKA